MNLEILLPDFIILTTSLLLILLEIISPERKGYSGALILSGLFLALVTEAVYFEKTGNIGEMLKVSAFERIFDFIFILGGILVTFMSIDYFKKSFGEYSFFIMTCILGMMLLTKSENLLMLFISLEIISFSLYVLIAFPKDKGVKAEASMKYFILGSFSSSFLLFGIALLLMSLGTLSMEEIMRKILTLGTGVFERTDILISLVLILIGFGFKLVFVPFQFWTPDVFEGASTPVVGLISALPKAAAFSALLKVVNFSFSGLKELWEPVLFWLAILTMAMGNFAALRERNIKRMLAFSTIAHAGYILVALIADSPKGFSSLTFYLFVYTFMSLGAFSVVSLFGDETDLNSLRGFSKERPGMAFFLAFFLIALAGIPPTAGFMAKFYIFLAAIEAHKISLALIGFIMSVIAVYYYMRVVVLMYMMEPEKPAPSLKMPFMEAVLWIGLFFVILLGVYPNALMLLTRFSF
jgi:NADH-quinone oxidoreductase subunit N